jgi:hypothetical protein
MLSDIISINGYNRTPYIALAGLIGAGSLTALFVIPVIIVLAVICMFGVNFSVSSPDVMIDADVAEKCKLYPKFASDLQALCWGAMSLFSVVGFASSGVMIKYAGPRLTFGILIITSLLILFPALFGFLGEKKEKPNPTRALWCRVLECNKKLFNEHRRIFMLAIFVSSCAVTLSIVVLATKVWLYRFITILIVAFAVASSVYFVNRRDLPEVANVALFIFLRESLSPDLETAMFYWYVQSTVRHLY